MTLNEFLDTIYIPTDQRVAVFCERTWEGAPEFSCLVEELKTYDDLMDKKVCGICAGGEIAMLELTDEEVDRGDNIIEIALDWDGDEL